MPPKPADQPAPDRLSWRQLFGYASGGLPLNFGTDALKQLAGPIYTIVLGVNPGLIGTMLMIARIWDTFTDPLMGVISDNTRTRWGRRRPYIALGALLSAVTFPLIWFVPADASPGFAGAYFLVTSIVFYTAFTVYCVPFVTLAMEISPDYAERTRVVGTRMLFSSIAGLIIAWAFRLTQLDIFSDPLSGMRTVGIAIGGLMMVFGLPAALATRERLHERVSQQPKQSIIGSFKAAFSNQPFRVLMTLTVLVLFGLYTTNALAIYVNTYYVFGGDMKKAATLGGLSGTVSLVTIWIVVPITVASAKRWGKDRVLAATLVMGVLGGIARWFLYNPRWPYAQLAEPLFLASTSAGFWILVHSMKADTCDWDELHSGVRREGAYAAVSSWLTKFSVALTFALSGLALVVIGFDQSLGGAQDAGTLLALRICFAGLPVLVFSGALVILRSYPLTSERMGEIRRALDERHQSPSPLRKDTPPITT